MFLCNGPIETAGIVAGVKFDFQDRFFILAWKILQLEGSPMRGSAHDVCEGNELFFLAGFIINRYSCKKENGKTC